MPAATHLYHKDVFLPQRVKETAVLKLQYSLHARTEAESDRYGRISLPLVLDTRRADLIEAEVEPVSRRVLKRVYRAPLDKERDIVLVVNPDGFVRTVWVNLKTDQHRSLDKRKFSTLPI